MKLFIAILAATIAAISAQTCTTVDNCNTCANPGPQCKECPMGYVLSVDQLKCLSCGTGCETCTADAADVVTCTECVTSYYLSTGACSYCGDGCLECHEETGIIVCDECTTIGYTQDMTVAAQTCVACDSNCKTCSMNEDSSTTCSECYSFKDLNARGYYLKNSDKTCKSCPSNCEKCTDDGSGKGICTSCYSSYEILVDEDDSTNDGTKCVRCPSECSGCTGVEFSTGVATCTDCDTLSGLYLSSGECLVCDANCVTCDDEGLCTECDTYYRVDSGSCVECAPFCMACSTDESTGDEICQTCKSNYGTKESTSITCDACGISNCDTCTRSSAGVFSCQTCKTNYGFDANSACTSCPSGCSACTYDTDHMKCTACKSGYTDTVYPAASSSSSSTPSICEECVSNCNSCDHDGSGDNQCASCDTGYHTETGSPDNTCESDLANCKTHDAAGACTACVDGYSVNSGACDECTANFCTTCDGALTACDACAETYTMVDADFDNTTESCESCGISKCLKCISWAGYAGATKMCFKCETGYIQYDSAAGSRKATFGNSCKKCPTGCDTCTVDYGDSDKTKCSSGGCKVWDGKKAYTNGDDGACEQCPSQCKACSWDSSNEATICDSNQCNTLYAKNDDSGECDACPDNCLDCEYDSSLSSVVCKDNQCDTGYGKISDGTCAACPGNCDVCSVDSATDADDTLFCSDCSVSYGINSDICGACPSNCMECNDNSGTMECSACKSGYALDSSKICNKCPTNCETCTATGTITCTDCKTGYALAGDKLSCIDCATAAFDNCATCTNINATTEKADCEFCNAGYVLQDELETLSCVSTSSLICNGGEQYDDGPQCSSCADGFTVTDEFECAIMCYTCGDVDSADGWVDQSSCTIPADGANATATDAELEECTEGACYAAYKDGQVIAGCMPMSVNGGMCTAAYQEEVCLSTATDNRCEQCCTSEKCNTFVATMDGTPDSGATSVMVSALLMAVSAILALSQ